MKNALELPAGRVFSDPCFRIFRYQDTTDSFYVALMWQSEDGAPLFGAHPVEKVVDRIVKPMLSEILSREAKGTFIPTEGFDFSERYVLMNVLTELVVCNL